MVIARQQLERIAHAALRIPTPENSQPWTMNICGNALDIFHSSARAKLASFPDDLSVLGMGILTEALEIASSVEGLAVQTTYFLENRNDDSPWLRAEFTPADRTTDPLAQTLSVRHTDRRYYAGGSLQDPIFSQVQQEVSRYSEVNLYFTDTYPPDYLQLIKEADQIVMAWDEYRHDLTRWVRFTEQHIERTRDGMPWRSLLRGSENWLYYLRSRLWWMAARLDWFPASLQKLETQLFDDSAELSPSRYDDGAGIGCITVSSDKPEDLIATGRLVLRIWLLLNQNNYAFQPITNLPSTIYPLHLGKFALPTELSHLLANGQQRLQRVFHYPDQEIPIFCFRVGLATGAYPTRARTLRKVDAVN